MSLPENELDSKQHSNVLRRTYRKVKQKYAGKIRDKAIERAKTRIYLHGRKPEDYDPDILEAIVREEEDKLISEYKSRGIVALVAALGLSLFP
ncbi:dihydrouridine synthase [Gilvimarinus sp. SDUM040013]|uniref:Dihydrouridine synthase n=1 Tax=Gilvimarinus gilvus TaxID=3058038 RepID=A0ABU4RZ44_9GAMM|nr:dihydrouridine synthase [Gilvimarinus sp. SDUM040013]MDO3388636.1 dihydrouridine synthase [Gilvimarinus sp. SDUM040013]MDX6849531.1 dihydrouridine synthase [Gilvimarinus sp. SDUM040013]